MSQEVASLGGSATVVSVCLSHSNADGPDSHGHSQLGSHDSGGCTSWRAAAAICIQVASEVCTARREGTGFAVQARGRRRSWRYGYSSDEV